MMPCLIPDLDGNVRKQQARFRSGRGCVDHIFAFRQSIGMCHAHGRPTIIVFLDLEGALDPVNQTALFSALYRKGIPAEFVKFPASIVLAYEWSRNDIQWAIKFIRNDY